MKNRIVCCTAALLLAAGGLGALPAGTLNTAIMASAATFENYEYTVDGDSVTITNYSGESGDVVIPSEIDGKKVAAIGYRAFMGCKKLTSITIPDSVTVIGEGAFQDCYGLKTAAIGNGVTKIDIGAFADCKSLDSVTFGNSVTEIGGSAFHYCNSLKSVALPDSLKIIGCLAFDSCEKLSSVDLGKGLTSVEFDAFCNCTSLKSVTLPASVKTIGSNAFGFRSEMEWGETDSYNEYYKLDDFTLYCYPGAGEKYAKDNGINYKLINGDLSKSDIQLTDGSKYAYTGKAIKPKVKVTLDGKTLKNKTDYKLFYKNNTEPGKAKVVVKGVGAFSGRGVKTFYIKPAAARITKLTSPRKKAVKLTWKRDKVSDGYQIFVSYSKNFKRKAKTVTIKKNATVAKTVTGLRSGKKCYMKIRAYKTVDGRKLYGKCSKTLSIKCK